MCKDLQTGKQWVHPEERKGAVWLQPGDAAGVAWDKFGGLSSSRSSRAFEATMRSVGFEAISLII